jgi:hypothetical protein
VHLGRMNNAHVSRCTTKCTFDISGPNADTEVVFAPHVRHSTPSPRPRIAHLGFTNPPLRNGSKRHFSKS